jgi:hypothetical protein
VRRFLVLLVFVSQVFVLSCTEKGEDKTKSSVTSEIPSVKVIAKTDRTKATVSQSIMYTIGVQYGSEIKVNMPEAGAKIAGLRITDFGENGPLERDGQLLHEKWFKLQPDIVGTYIIPSMTVSYIEETGDKKELKTPQIFLEVVSSLTNEEGEKSVDIIDIKPLQKMERDLKLFVFAGCAAAVLLVVAVCVFLYLRKRKKNSFEKRRPAHLIALEDMEKLEKDGLIERGIVKEYYFRLSDIFRTYIENRFDIPAVEQTTPELVPEINRLEKTDSEVKLKAEEFLKYSDLVKFAKYSPQQEEIEANRQKIVSVIAETKEEEKKEETK